MTAGRASLLAAGTGRRLPDGEHPVLPGDYSHVDGEWWAKPPVPFEGAPQQPGRRMGLHVIGVHDDGTITVSPSLLYPEITRGEKPPIPEWHGYLECGVWRQV